MKREYFIKNAKWYQEMLGFRVAGKFPGKGGHNVYFLENLSDGKMYEISQRDQLPGGATTRVEHIAYRSEELEKDYTYCKEHGYKILSDEIEVSPNFWEKGSRCFKIESPCACGFFWLLKNFLLYKAVSVIIVKEIVLQKQNELSEYSELHEKYKKY